MRQCKRQVPGALTAYNQIEQTMIALIQQFTDEVNRFEVVLANRKDFGSKKINFIAQFPVKITVMTPLSMRLIAFIGVYDQLVAVLKLLHLAGCFASNHDYFANIKRIQMPANQMLSHVMLFPAVERPY